MADKSAIYELQKIDCNCNDCIFMVRDFETYNRWEAFHRDIAVQDFERVKKKAFEDANATEDLKSRQIMLDKVKKMKFQFDKSHLFQYGSCNKFNKKVSFLPGNCQIHTQDCFKHRRD